MTTLKKVSSKKYSLDRVDTYSKKIKGGITGFLISLIVCFLLEMNLGESALVILIVSIIGMLIAPSRVVRHVPKVDLVDLEYHPLTHKVRAKFDDGRTKRKQPATVDLSPKINTTTTMRFPID